MPRRGRPALRGPVRTACLVGGGSPARRHIRAKSSSPSECAPSQMSGMTASSRARLLAAPHALPRRGESVRASQSLLEHETQDQDGGAVGAGVIGCSDRRELGLDPGDAGTDHRPDRSPPGGPHAGARPPSARHRHAHRDRGAREPGQAGRVQGTDAVEDCPGTGLPHRAPAGAVDRERTGADDDGVGAGSGPAPGSHLGAHVAAAHTARAQVPAVRDPSVVSGQAPRNGGSLRARHAAPGLLGHRATLARMAGGSLTPCGQLVCAMQGARSGAPSASHRPSLSG